jgi:hypothetical protein
MPGKIKKAATMAKEVIGQDQWKMPVSFDRTGKLVSLHDYLEGDRNALAFSSLTDDQRVELAATRIQMQPDYSVASIGAGVVTKDRAVEEVRAKTKLGRRLAQIEARVVTHLIDQAKKKGGSARG